MDIVSRVCDIYENNVAFAFNGGKESDIVLNMIRQISHKIKIYYVRDKNDFPEISEHVEYMSAKYNLNLIIYDDMKNAIIDLKDNYGVKAILTGIRRSDPAGITSHFQKSDKNWPEITIVSPLLNWEYKHVWEYILTNDIEYCELYNRGYTSIGVIGNTFPNYHLFDGDLYDHASKLKDGGSERQGRIPFLLPIELSGKVIKGKGLANSVLGIPTANLNTDNKDVGIIEGVYIGYTYVNNNRYQFVMSCGKNPQFGDQSFEVHIIDMPYMYIYDIILNITITDYIRPMEKYSNIDELKTAICKDIQIARKMRK